MSIDKGTEKLAEAQMTLQGNEWLNELHQEISDDWWLVG